jgi:hypothetical protein
VRTIARVEVVSEDWRYPIESAFDETDERGWRAAEPRKQTIRRFFDEPQRIRRIWRRFIELEAERTQQFTLQWSKDKTDALRPLFHQQWNFSPSGSTSEIEDYEVDLNGVWVLQLVIDPDIARGPDVGLIGATVKSSTRSIVSEDWPGRLLAFSLLHEPYHGVHDQRAGLPHAELPQHVGALVPTTPDEQCPYPSYRHALLDLLRSLTDPRVGAQWRTATPSRT